MQLMKLTRSAWLCHAVTTLLAMALLLLPGASYAQLAEVEGIAAAAAPKSKAPVCTETILPNGLKVLLLEDHSYPVVSCLAWYGVGSRNERIGNTGISHLLEHLLFGNVGTFRKGEIGATVARVGGQFNGYTSDDFTTFFETLPAHKLELALRIESERMRGARFNDADLQEELVNVQREFEAESKDPQAILSQEVRSLLYVQHPYHNPTIGWRADLENITAAALKSYYDKYFWPNNCTLVVAGDFDTKSVSKLVDTYFGVLPKSPSAIPVLKITPEIVRGERRSTVKYSGKQDVLEMAFRAPAFQDPDAPATVVLEKLLSAPYAGRLKSKLVEQKVCSGASCAYEMKKDPGFFSITCTATSAPTSGQQKIIEAVDAMLAQLRSQPPSDTELRRARNQAEFAFYSEREGPYRAGFHLGYFENLGGWKESEKWAERLRAVTPADVQRVAKKYFESDTRVIAWLQGANTPKVTPSKVEPAGPAPRTVPAKPEHTRLTGYKADDLAPGPKSPRDKFDYIVADIAVERDQAYRQAVKKNMPTALPTAVEKLPAAVGNATQVIKELPTAVEKVPTVIKSIPSAVGSIPEVIKQLPGTIGSVPSAIKEIPSAIGNMPGAAATVVKDLPATIGGIPATAANAIKELPGAITAIPGATADAIKGVPAALGAFASELGGLGKQLVPHDRVANGPTSKRVLSNGLTLVVHESHLAPIVQIGGVIRAGRAYEPSGKPGVSAVAAAVFNNGTSRRGRAQVQTQQEDNGIQPGHMLKFDRGADCLQFSTRCLSRDAGSQVELLAETLSSPALSDAEVEKAKQDVISDVQRYEDTNSRKAERAILRSLLATGSPLSLPDPSELVKSVSSLSAADLRKFLNTSVAPGTTTIVMVGDIDPDRAAKLAEKAFAGWNVKTAHQKIAVHHNPRQVLRTAVPTKDKSKTTIGFAKLVALSPGHNDYSNFLLADVAFSKHPFMSRLSQKTSNDDAFSRALGNCPETDVDHFIDATAWSLVTDVEPNAVPLVVSVLQKELKQFAKEGITKDEFSEAKRYLLGALPVRSMSTIGSLTQTLMSSVNYSPEPSTPAMLISSLRATNLEAVNRLIKHTLKPELCTMVVVGNSQSIRSTRRQVAAQAAAESAGDDAGNKNMAATGNSETAADGAATPVTSTSTKGEATAPQAQSD